ncbi:MAG: ABC transporter ATP-binding protein [Oscillibacter sp.]|nr:ABC transporter ATP-binding protein [Oscillibacter sp.]
MIEVKNLVKRYGNHCAVDHLSFTVEDGQIFGFLGPNGAGKSTTMNMITGCLAATEGDVVIEGHNILEEPEAARRCVGYLPELPPLYDDMTVREYLSFAAELKKIPKAERENQIGRVVALTHLEDAAGRLIRNLSKGYRQRVGLAQAILGFPRIIILDEPTVGLDPKQVVEIREMVRSLAREHTVLISSHILSEIREICDHVLIIRKGKFVACDTPEHLEELLSANNQTELLVRGTREETERILASVEGLRPASFADGGGDAVRVALSADRDVRESLFFAFAKAGTPLLELRPRMASLEDVFLNLTDDDDQVAAGAAALLQREAAPACAAPADEAAREETPEPGAENPEPDGEAVPEKKEGADDESHL